MKCSECGKYIDSPDGRAIHVDACTKSNPKKVSLGVVCSKYCAMVLEERARRWPETYIRSKQK